VDKDLLAEQFLHLVAIDEAELQIVII